MGRLKALAFSNGEKRLEPEVYLLTLILHWPLISCYYIPFPKFKLSFLGDSTYTRINQKWKQTRLTCKSSAASLPFSPEFLVYSSMVQDGCARFTSASSVRRMSV